ncbi:hypothetical protein B0E53_06848 [Micromonospora sp. MH33]|nr:hypothetical protein B0E53_06848 [Micromonospora sp. MH33]
MPNTPESRYKFVDIWKESLNNGLWNSHTRADALFLSSASSLSVNLRSSTR